MITTTFILLTLTAGITTVLTLAPLTMGLWVLIIALLTAARTALSLSSWFRFIIFLIYIGGILVIFAYFTAIQPNQQLKIMPPLTIMLFTRILFPIFYSSSTINSFNIKNWWISSIYETANAPSLIFLALALFLALIRVVKISFLRRSPLRPFSYV